MATLRDFQKYVHIWLDKYTGQFLVLDKRHLKIDKTDQDKKEISDKHILDLTKQYAKMSDSLHEYCVQLENLAVELIRENFILKGLTPTDQDIVNRLNKGGVNRYQRIIKI